MASSVTGTKGAPFTWAILSSAVLFFELGDRSWDFDVLSFL